MPRRRLAVVAASAIALLAAVVTTPARAANGDNGNDNNRRTTTTEKHHRTTTTTTEHHGTTTTTTEKPHRTTTTGGFDTTTTSTGSHRSSTTSSTTKPHRTTTTVGNTTTTAKRTKGEIKRFIVVLRPDVLTTHVADEHQRARNFHVERTYSSALHAYVGDMDDSDAAAVSADPRVDYLQPVHDVSINDTTGVSVDKKKKGGGGGGGGTPGGGQILPWGVERVSRTGDKWSSTHPGDGTGSVNLDVYIVDTGVAANPDLSGGTDANLKGGPNTDCNGHGTHMAGIIGALDNTTAVVGVAPGVRVHGVKVLDCSGKGTDVNAISGLEWIRNNGHLPAVINMSFGGPISAAFDQAIQNVVAAGYTVTVAAGNDHKDACTQSPAHMGTLAGVMTVGATGLNDTPAGFSDWGKCVDVWAPGVKITSLFPGGLAVADGTSASAPHAAGVAALFLAHGGASPASVESAVKSNAIATAKSHGDTVLRVSAANF